MTAFLQMGHHSENLVGINGMEGFGGIILSPVNRPPDKLKEDVKRSRERGEYEVMLDPQMYAPRVERGRLPEHSYFPSDADTADLTSAEWWEDRLHELAQSAQNIGVDTVAAPILVPKVWSDEYLGISMHVADRAGQILSGVSVYATCLVSMAELTDRQRRLELASIFSQPDVAGYYLILYSETEPRREIRDVEELFGAMSFVRLLESTGLPVIVGYCSSDLVLYKTAGASHCATGKFFNLRRFTKSRFEEPPSGAGGQLAYWFEEGLIAFLREADLQRVRGRFPNHVMRGASDNVWSQNILEKLDKGRGSPWLGDSWRQYLSWFSNKERELDRVSAGEMYDQLGEIEERWGQLTDQKVLMEERHNDGGWLRAWRQALAELDDP